MRRLSAIGPHERHPIRATQTRADAQGGQAAVEAAIVLPLFLFLILGLLQLTMLYHARVLAEYAAFQAARAGIVWNGDPARMNAAAYTALAPTICPTRLPALSRLCSIAGSAEKLWAKQAAGVIVAKAIADTPLPGMLAGVPFPGVHVNILSPDWDAHNAHFKLGENEPGKGGGEELDFDDLAQGGDAGYRQSTLLTIRVLYWYELKIPFADYVIWTSYLASLAGLSLTGSIGNPTVDRGVKKSIVEDGNTDLFLAEAGARIFSDDTGREEDEVSRGEKYRLIDDASLFGMYTMGALPVTGQRIYFIPIVTHYTMRMQSNFYRKFIQGCRCSMNDNCAPPCAAW